MLQKIKYWVLGLGLLFTAPSCDDYLEKYPLEGPSDASFFTNESELLLAINACYSSLAVHPSDNLPLPMLLDNAADISWDRNNSDLQQIGKGSHASNNGFVRNVWQQAYTDIGRCNFLLDNIDKVKDKTTPQLYARTKAEARFLRAFNYSHLVELFGGIPLVTKTLKLEEASLPKSSKEEVVNFILTELEEAAADLPVSYDAQNNGRATKGAALAIKSRTALYNGKWEVAAKAAKDVMDLNYHKLHPNFGQLFTYAGQNSTEIIFAYQYLRGIRTHTVPQCFFSRMGRGNSNKVPGQVLIDAYECTDGLTIDKSPLYNPLNPFVNRDPRLGYTVALPGSTFLNIKFETNKDSLKTTDFSTTPARRVDNVEATHAFATFTGYCWRKYTDIIDQADVVNSELNIIAARYAEVLLNYAEAKIELGQLDPSVYDAINAVRQRPSVNMPAIEPGKTQAELRSVVRKERKYELANEGLRLYDIRRWKIADQVMNGTFYGRIPKGLLATAPAIDANGTPNYATVPNRADMRVVELRAFDAARDYLWPIPNIEVLTNTNLEQNPKY
ncbi:RagB/SusD family nutrient uptake outer membrane protein [Adhaeribacter rhizoryzae]|uniref:RagB/SusD family nutrient uptake outer membrane protein n=1 Tax=Adhaeribacter rhizoryzae TaxID=2607907 RepID=A0A5M6DN57_9BACT|nr:RagB/SusD family nutrient uptake outer membrane protein [Adhaeribacter rhizoryzae]KAA5548843.1 RagB/SusD family nutrient uptake outer membrane protein [Adhaeribacter rhizoryzae]